MNYFNFESFSRNFNPHNHTVWLPVAKTGIGFILAGLLILLLKELLAAILSTLAFGIGIYIVVVAYRIYRMNEF